MIYREVTLEEFKKELNKDNIYTDTALNYMYDYYTDEETVISYVFNAEEITSKWKEYDDLAELFVDYPNMKEVYKNRPSEYTYTIDDFSEFRLNNSIDIDDSVEYYCYDLETSTILIKIF